MVIINVYAPHSGRTQENPQETERFYQTLQEVIEKNYRNTTILLVAGDFNAKIGKKLSNDENFMGKYSRGIRNTNGRHLAELLLNSNFYLTNTHFQHPAKHITTWQSRGANKKNNL